MNHWQHWLTSGGGIKVKTITAGSLLHLMPLLSLFYLFFTQVCCCKSRKKVHAQVRSVSKASCKPIVSRECSTTVSPKSVQLQTSVDSYEGSSHMIAYSSTANILSPQSNDSHLGRNTADLTFPVKSFAKQDKRPIGLEVKESRSSLWKGTGQPTATATSVPKTPDNEELESAWGWALADPESESPSKAAHEEEVDLAALDDWTSSPAGSPAGVMHVPSGRAVPDAFNYPDNFLTDSDRLENLLDSILNDVPVDPTLK